MQNYTNVKGGMTSWDHYVENDNFKGFIAYLINAHQISHPKIFEYFLEKNTIQSAWGNEIKFLMLNLDMAWNHYAKNTGALDAYDGGPFHFTSLKIQKTLPTEGYHVWHIEHGKGFDNEPRAFVFSVYLNDIEEGGETEFLHFSKRVQPKTGRIVFWPAGFPYVHRGNSPLSGEKYLLTSWILLR